MMQVVKLLIVAITSYAVFSCTGKSHLSGKIVDSKTKMPLEQVSVLLRHKDSLAISNHYLVGTIANSEGVYSLDYKGDLKYCVLYFGMVGYVPKIVNNILSFEMPLDVALEPDTAQHVDFIPKQFSEF